MKIKTKTVYILIDTNGRQKCPVAFRSYRMASTMRPNPNWFVKEIEVGTNEYI